MLRLSILLLPGIAMLLYCLYVIGKSHHQESTKYINMVFYIKKYIYRYIHRERDTHAYTNILIFNTVNTT